MKRIFAFFMILCVAPATAFAVDANGDVDPMDFENFIVTDAGTDDINLSSVALNVGASSAAVSGFDIAGIMLGMSFDDVQTLFFKTRGLYAPRKENSIIYSIAQDWKYNLD